jgi:hypothetical protein
MAQAAQPTVSSITTSMGATVNINYGQSITVTGQVQKSPGGSGPTGTMDIRSDLPGFTTILANIPVSGTPASMSVAMKVLPPGTYNLSVHYNGDANFAPSDSAGIPVNVSGSMTPSVTVWRHLRP